jgi:hypothetical protein
MRTVIINENPIFHIDFFLRLGSRNTPNHHWFVKRTKNSHALWEPQYFLNECSIVCGIQLKTK